jgi:hypothetical protein
MHICVAVCGSGYFATLYVFTQQFGVDGRRINVGGDCHLQQTRISSLEVTTLPIPKVIITKYFPLSACTKELGSSASATYSDAAEIVIPGHC